MTDIDVSFGHGLGPLDGQFDGAGGRSFRHRKCVFVDELLGDADADAVGFEEDFVDGNGVEAGEVFDVAGSDVETGAVPRATHSAGGVSS